MEEIATGHQASLKTRDLDEARRLLAARNEAVRDTIVSREVGMAFLTAADPDARKRSWEWVVTQIVNLKSGATRARWEVASRDKALDTIRQLPLVETRAEHFLAVLHRSGVSTNVYLRRLHNFALDMGWLGRAVILRRQWPAVKYRKKRGVTWEEHQKILAGEGNPERRDFYDLAWETGAAQSDLASLTNEDIDWAQQTLRFFRKKTGAVTYLKVGKRAAEIMRRCPTKGPLFPYLATVRSNDRSTEFGQRCRLLGITGISLHSYRYAWAKRARQCGYPLRFAMLALGQSSKAIHAHYAGTDEVSVPSLEEFEQSQREQSKVVKLASM